MQGEHLEICEPHGYLNNISSDEECIGEYKNIFAVDDTTIVLTVYSYRCNCHLLM